VSRTRVTTLVLVALAVLAVAWAVLRLAQTRGAYPPAVPWAVPVVIAVLAAGVLAGGLLVRGYLHGSRPSLHGVRAARLTMLGKAAAHAGAALAGWYGAQAVLLLPLLEFEPERARLAPALAACAASVVLAAAGMVTERLGRLPPPTDDLTADGEVRHHGAHD